MDGMFARGVTIYHRPEGSTIKVILEKMLEGTSNTKTTQLGNDTFVPHPVEGTSNVKGHYKVIVFVLLLVSDLGSVAGVPPVLVGGGSVRLGFDLGVSCKLCVFVCIGARGVFGF
ncbi:hypothetical protein Pmani_004277 [Petrolisthes manimaculis]|uniref:Uncharacterized protein n=1 Tax=Petrolisthes manimaculis TaxID=1843537 RepID=A0AAE1QGT9_9EUCA|nr:hypothetical protein Pmani_004277 [Petrolisthes manimaculis]